MTRTLLILACLLSTPASIAEPMLRSYNADYELLQDGKLVGKAYFRVEIAAEGTYQMEVFTVPAGHAATNAQAVEVYEVSNGHIQEGIPIPQRYYFSAGKGNNTQPIQYLFDWAGDRIKISNGSQQIEKPLLQYTQDRLSYILLAAQLIEPQEPAKIVFSIAGQPDGQTSQLTRGGQKQIEVEDTGSFLATEIRRTENSNDNPRILWISNEQPRLPVSIEWQRKDGKLTMKLLGFSRPH